MAPRGVRPIFVSQFLLSRSIPAFNRFEKNQSNNAVVAYPELVKQINELTCHPLLKTCLHVMNDDIKNARTILVKLPTEKGFFSWLNGYLFSLEGEMLKSKTAYEETPRSILIAYHNVSPSIPPHLQVSHLLDHLCLLLGLTPIDIRAATEKANLCPKEAWTAAELVERGKVERVGPETIRERVERMRWEEVKGIFKSLEDKIGWAKI